METVILCGGRGTRLREYTSAIPKVLVEVGRQPILWHIMRSYAHHGFDDFILALGYLQERVREYAEHSPSSWHVRPIDTGLDTNTGGRLKLLEDTIGGDVFFVTYGDGVSDIDLQRLRDYHLAHGRIATVTVVRPHLSFGLLDVGTDHAVRRFDEKPQLEAWINGGFFVFDRRIFNYLSVHSVLEREPMQALVADRQLVAFQHTGFWKCMDTYKDNIELNAAWASGEAPWQTWARR
jgi:glucose-1-phosphate cytidylyltransferase